MILQGVVLLSVFSLTQPDKTLRSWKNNQIEAICSAHPVVGEPLIIGVRHSKDFLRPACKFHAPSFWTKYGTRVYRVKDGVVYDNNGQEVGDMEPWDDGGDPLVCGLKTVSYTHLTLPTILLV